MGRTLNWSMKDFRKAAQKHGIDPASGATTYQAVRVTAESTTARMRSADDRGWWKKVEKWENGGAEAHHRRTEDAAIGAIKEAARRAHGDPCDEMSPDVMIYREVRLTVDLKAIQVQYAPMRREINQSISRRVVTMPAAQLALPM